MPTATTTPIKFWIICREDTELTRQLIQSITHWQLPGVQARIGHQISLAVGDAIAHSDFAIFITLSETPGAHVQISPVSTTQARVVQSPANLLNTLRQRHGHAPQAWWFQLPTTEIRAYGIKPVSVEETLSQTLKQIEVFVRNHYLKPLAMHKAFAPQPASAYQPAEGHPSEQQTVHVAA